MRTRKRSTALSRSRIAVEIQGRGQKDAQKRSHSPRGVPAPSFLRKMRPRLNAPRWIISRLEIFA
jgi:hypothetical protein